MKGPQRPIVFGIAAMLALLAVISPADARDPHERYRKRKPAPSVTAPPTRHFHAGVVASLPRSYVRLEVRGKDYFYAFGIFYQREPGGYVVVSAPVGARVSVLPPGYRRVMRSGATFYMYYGTYYRFDAEYRDYVVVDAPAKIPSKDVVLLVDGETMEGRLLKSDGETIDFLMDGEIYEIPVSDVVSIDFAPPA